MQDYNYFENRKNNLMGGRSREERLFQTLAEKGEYAEIDKAKHNENYKNYLLQNFENYSAEDAF